MAFDPKAFIAEIVNGSKLDDATKAALTSAASDPAVSARFQNLYENGLRQDEFSRKMNEYDAKLKSVATYQGSLKQWQTDYEKEVEARFQTELDKVKRQSGGGLYEPDPAQGKSDVDWQKKIDEIVKQQEMYNQNMFVYNNTLTKLGLQHMKEFGDALDVDSLVNFANERGKNILDAYETFVQPQRKEIQDKLFQDQLLKAREEGAAEARKNMGVPGGAIPTTLNNGIPHAVERLKEAAGEQSKFGAMAAVQAFMKEQGA